jgi:UDP-glucuronate 4-epimerase
MSHGIGSVGLRPFVVYGPGRDQGMTSGPTVAMFAAAAGVSYRIGFGGKVLLTYAPDCARAFIDAARATAGSDDALCLNMPGRRTSMAQVVDLIEEVLPAARGLISYEATPIRVPALLEAPALSEVVGDVANRPLGDGVRATITHFREALAAGLLAPPGSWAM